MIAQTVLPFKLEKTSENLTAHAGLIAAHELHLGVGLNRVLDAKVPGPRSNRGYRPSEVVLPLVLMLQGGGMSLNDINVIRDDRALRTACGLQAVPDESTLGDLLRRYGSNSEMMQGMADVQDHVNRIMLWEGKTANFTLDADASIIPADKQDAAVAYEGTRGYQPMLGFLFENRCLIHDEFRPGNASPAEGIVRFIDACRKRMPAGCRIARFRSDSAAYNHFVTDYCEEKKLTFAIGADWDAAVTALLNKLTDADWTQFTTSGSRIEREVAETVHTFNDGAATFRLIFVRDVVKQRELFPTGRRQRAIITNASPESMTAVQAVEWYNQRGTAENYIKELKYNFGLRRVPCGQFAANAAWLRIASLAYNLFLLQQALTLPEELKTASVSTVRWQLYQTPARIVRHAHRLVVKLAASDRIISLFQAVREGAFNLAVQYRFT